MISLFDLTEFTAHVTGKKLFADDQFESLAKELQKTFGAFREVLQQAALCQRLDVSLAFDSLSKFECRINESMKPMLAAFQGLQDALDLGRNQRMFTDLVGTAPSWVKQIEELSKAAVNSSRPEAPPVIETTLENFLAASASKKLRAKTQRRERPRLAETHASFDYKETKMGYLAILAQPGSNARLQECDDDEL